MTQRDAVDVAALDLRDRLFPVPTKSSDWAITDARRADALDAIADALRSVSNSRAEAMRSGLDIGAAEMELSRVLSEYDYEMPADGMRRVIEAALPLPAPGAPASPWRVKKLEWRKPADHPQDPEDAALVAVGIGGRYAISKPQLTAAFGPNGHLLWDAKDNFSFTEHRTIANAQAAAQVDFERCIRSAIEPDLPTSPASKDT